MSDDRLHRKWEPRMQPGRLYSLLDIMGGEAVCDECGNWQRIPTLSERDLAREAHARGWVTGEKDYCPECVASGKGPSKAPSE